MSAVKDVDIVKVLVSNKISSGEKNYKYFIGYLYGFIKLSHYIYYFQKRKCM